MPAEVVHVINQAEIRSILRSEGGGVARDIYKRGKRVEAVAKRGCPVDIGRLRASINTRMVVRNGAPAAEIGTNVNYALAVHEGTGVYGRFHRPIRPKRGKYLVFRPRGSRVTIFARQVRGVPGRPFLRNALPAARG